MYIVDDIAYANDSRPAIRICGVRPLPNHHLWVRFNDGTAKDVDFTPILNDPAFRPLQDEHAFGRAYIDFNTVVWMTEKSTLALTGFTKTVSRLIL